MRKLSSRSTLEQLKREAKRWYKALRDGDATARARLRAVVPNPPSDPSLRDVQLALAHEYGFDGWDALKHAVDAIEHQRGGSTTADLLQAALLGDTPRVAAILDANPTLVNERGSLSGHTGLRTALHFAVGQGRGNEETIKLLLARGADPNIRDKGDNAFPLHFAAEQLDVAIVRLLIEHGADPIGAGDTHELDVIGWAAVFEPVYLDVDGDARIARRRAVVDYLLAHGARHTMFSAVAMGDVDDIRRAARDDRTSLDRTMDRANQHRRPLHLAIVKRQLQSLATLLELGANTELMDAAGLTPLDQAALQHEGDFADVLLAHGARLRLPAAIGLDRDVERLLRENAGELAPGKRWGTLIVRAAERSPGRTIERLIAHGASPNAIDDEATAVDGAIGYSALHAAAFHGNAKAVAVLLNHGANVTARDSRYHGTPAGWADYARHPALRDMILAGPIDMFDAVMHHRVDRLREIFDRDPASLNRPLRTTLIREPRRDEWIESWWTPLAMACKLVQVDAARELIALGARTDVTSPDGRSLRDLATQSIATVGTTEEEGSQKDTVSSDSRTATLTALLDTSNASSLQPISTDRDALVARFLANACPDHHIRGGASHDVARHVAMQLLRQHPALARDNLYTAVACGELDFVTQLLAENPSLASKKGGPKGSANAQSQRFVVSETPAAHPRWEPLLYLCYARLGHPATNANAVDIARRLLDHGADPNAYFMAGDSRYSPLSGVVGEGEEHRPAHPRRDELARLLLDRGANPYDKQVYYNIHFNGRLRWFLEMIYEETTKRGRQSDWDNPDWPMLDMGRYGSGARFTLEIALRNNDVDLVTWSLAHGANPNAHPTSAPHSSQRSLYEEADRRGLDDIAALLLNYGAETRIGLDATERFNRACIRRDRDAALALLTEDPALVESHVALHAAAARDDPAVAAFVLDLGVSPNVADPTSSNQLALHVAALHDSVAVGRLLIERGAEIDRREDSYGATPLGFAIYGNNTQMMKVLSEYSADIWNLALLGAVDRVRAVIAERPELAKVSWSDGTTPLMTLPGDEQAALEIAQLLLAAGADPSVRNTEGQTAAAIATSRDMPLLATLLAALDSDSQR